MVAVSLKHRLEYLLLKGAAVVVRCLPRSCALSLGRLLGRLALKLLPERRRLTRDNMERALPELDVAELDQLVRKNFEQVGASAMEMLRLDLFRSGGEDLARYFDIEGEEHLRQAADMGRGVLMLTAHLGFWEAGFFVAPELGYPTSAVAKPMKNPLVDAYFTSLRETFGGEVLNSKKGARRILNSLKQGKAVAILLDQHISPPGSIETEFFGRKAYTTTAITNLAMKYGVPVVPMFNLRESDDRYRLWIEKPLLLEGEGEQAVAENTQLLTMIIENAIRRDVSQWFWMHRRWRVKRKRKRAKT
jgi:KDO2-lipid IV(A) lauroyltransferase